MVASSRKAPLTRAQRDARAHRRTRLVHVLVTALMFVLALAFALVVGTKDYHASAIGWMPLIAGVVIVVASFVYQRILARSLKISDRAGIGQCERGASVAFCATFSNASPLPFFRIDAYFCVSERGGHRLREVPTTLMLAPLETYEMELTIEFSHVGTYLAGLDRVVVHDFLGLFSSTIPSPARQSVQVVPCVRNIRELPLSTDSVTESATAAKATLADSLDYAHVREYASGDPLKTVHWKLSARGNGLYTRLFEVYSNPSVAVFMHFHASAEDAEGLLGIYDTVVECALSTLRYAVRVGMDAEVCFVDRFGQECKRSAAEAFLVPELLADLPLAGFDRGRARAEESQLRREGESAYGKSNLVVCTANLDEGLIGALLDAKAHRRCPYLFAVVPRGLAGRELEERCALLSRLDSAGVGYIVLSDSSELEGAGL